MAVNFQSRAWQKLCYQDHDHMSHVKAYWTEQFKKAIERAPKFTKTFNPRGCNNGLRDWYERGYVPMTGRYPTIYEDPDAYVLAGD